MNFKKMLISLCTFSVFTSCIFYCKAGDPKKEKVSIIGDTGTGKTQICKVLDGEKFQEDGFFTIGVDFTRISESGIDFLRLDISGCEAFMSTAAVYSNHSSLGIFVCDLSNEKTIEDFKSWFELYTKQSKGNKGDIIIVGNKVDMIPDGEARKILAQRLTQKALNMGIMFPKVILVSAKTGENIIELKKLMVEELRRVIVERKKGLSEQKKSGLNPFDDIMDERYNPFDTGDK